MGVESVLPKAVSWAAKTLWGYFSIWHYLKTEMLVRSGKAREFEYADEADYWQGMGVTPGLASHRSKNGTLSEGDIVTLRDFQVSQWVPLLPGTWWTRHATKSREQVYQKEESSVFYPEPGIPVVAMRPLSKTMMMMTGGYGSVRLKSTTRTAEGYALFCATSSGNSWQGIPILVCPAVADRLISWLSKGGIEAARIRGRLLPLPGRWRERLSHIASSHAAQSLIDTATASPDLVLVIESALNAELRESDYKISAVAWVNYELSSLPSDEHIHDLRRLRLGRTTGDENATVPGFTYHIFDAGSAGQYAWARTFLRGYAAATGAGRILAEYDEYQPWSWEPPRFSYSEIRYGNEHAYMRRVDEGRPPDVAPRPVSRTQMLREPSPSPRTQQDQQPEHPSLPEREPAGPSTRSSRLSSERLRDEMDALIDEIDEVREENAEKFVQNYVQRGSDTENLVACSGAVPREVAFPLRAVIDGEFSDRELHIVMSEMTKWQQALALVDYRLEMHFFSHSRAPGAFHTSE